MSSELTSARPATIVRSRSATRRRRTLRRSTALTAYGEPMLWLCGGALALALAMIAGLLLLVASRGLATFWPGPLVRLERADGAPALLGEVRAEETFVPVDTAAPVRRRMLRTGNFEITGTHFHWVADGEVTRESYPEWALVVERVAWGRFYGEPRELRLDDSVVASEPADVLSRFEELAPATDERRERRRKLETDVVGEINSAMEELRLGVRATEIAHGAGSEDHAAAERRLEQDGPELERRFEEVRAEIARLAAEDARHTLVLETADGGTKELAVADVVRAHAPNRLSLAGKTRVFLARWKEFLVAAPREANSEGGVFPAIFGTVAMTLIMTLLVVPFGVLAALYLREYAKAGALVTIVRICVNNLAGVPSIVFGVFGLGFFCYVVGASIDQLFFAERLPNPTYGKGGLLWASLTLALLTLPVVIVATEEALAAVPRSMREGSYACGATQWQTIRRIVLPRAMPGILTGAILAIARGAGEVAPLMLVGAVKLAPTLAIDSVSPYVHPERSFMHLGFHIFDLGFQSQNSEAAKPMVYATTSLLIAIVVALNLTAVIIRGRLRRRFAETSV